VDIKRSWLGKNIVVFGNGKQYVKANLIEYVKRMETNGAGELIIQSVDRDGTYQGLDQHVLSEISNELSIPITGIGGLSCLKEINSVHNTLKLNGYGAGSLFVFQSKNQGVLVNYPSREELQSLF
jgi:cyclase